MTETSPLRRAAGAIAWPLSDFPGVGWMTGGSADRMAAEKARHAVVAILVPICIEQSKQDPEVNETLARMKDASTYKCSDMVMEVSWATMPGAIDLNRSVASACLEQLAAQF